MKKTVLAAALAAVFSTNVGAAVLGTEPFEINTTAYGGADVKDIGAVDYSFALSLDSVSDKFNIAGIGFASSLRKSLGLPPIAGTGLNENYNIYAQVIAGGSAVPINGNTFLGTYNNFHADVRIDPNRDSKPDGTGQADDVTIYSGDLKQGASINSINLETGLFKVLLHTTFTLPPQFKFEYTSQPDVLLTGVFAGDALGNFGQTQFNQEILGSGNFTAAVPEPGTWAMLLAGIFAIFGAVRRKL